MSDRNIAPRTDGITSQGIFLGVAECKYEMPSSPTLLPGEKGARTLVLSLERRELELLSPLLGERVRVRAKSMLHKSI